MATELDETFAVLAGECSEAELLGEMDLKGAWWTQTQTPAVVEVRESIKRETMARQRSTRVVGDGDGDVNKVTLNEGVIRCSKIYAKSRIFYSTFCIDFGAFFAVPISTPNFEFLCSPPRPISILPASDCFRSHIYTHAYTHLCMAPTNVALPPTNIYLSLTIGITRAHTHTRMHGV